MDPLEVNDDLRGNPNDVPCLLHHADARLASSLFAWYSRPRPSTGPRESRRELHRQYRRRSNDLDIPNLPGGEGRTAPCTANSSDVRVSREPTRATNGGTPTSPSRPPTTSRRSSAPPTSVGGRTAQHPKRRNVWRTSPTHPSQSPVQCSEGSSARLVMRFVFVMSASAFCRWRRAASGTAALGELITW
jgi:hypothetical protein